MRKTALVFGRTNSAFTKRILRAVKREFPDYEIVVYLLGRPTSEIRSFLEQYSPNKVIWDIKLDHDRPNKPDNTYLMKFEERHGSLRKCLFADRKLSRNSLAGVFNDRCPAANDATLRTHCEARARQLETVFNERKIAFVFGQQISYLGGMMCALLAESHDIPFFRAGHTRVADRFTLHNGPYEYSSSLWNRVESAVTAGESFPTWDSALSFMKKVREGGDLYWNPLPSNYDKDRRSWNEQFRYIVNLLKDERGGITTNYYAETPTLRIFAERIKKQARKRLLGSSDVFERFDPSRRCVYFPLQVQPEQSLMIWARYYTELDTLARNIAQSLPIDVTLYVNDHPNNWGVRPLNYFRRLRWAPNLFPLDRSADTRTIIKAAEAVICVTASVGLEALILGKPVLTFGTAGRAPTYANLDTVRTVIPAEGLDNELTAAMNDSVDEREVTAYVAASLDHGIPRAHPEFPRRVCEQIAAEVGR